MKKILVVITTSLVPYGGLATVALNYYRHININKYSVDFLSSNELCTDLKDELQKNGSFYYRLNNRNVNPLLYFINLRKICKKYDVVHIHANSATSTIELLAAKYAGVKKRIVHIHNTTCSHMLIHKILKKTFNKSYTYAIACSEAAGEWIFPANKYTVLSNAIDLEKYKFNTRDRDDIRKKYNIISGHIIGNVGKLTEQKNHSYALDVFSKYLENDGNAKLMIVGGGILENKLKEKAKKLGIEESVIFCGMQNSAIEYYSAFDCVLFPSLWEGLPLSLVEAQACGLYCVTSDCITSEVDMGGVKQLNLNKEIDLWSKTIELIINSKREENIIKFRKNIIIKDFDIKNNVKKLEKIYDM